MAAEVRKEAARDSRASGTQIRPPATHELRCGLGPLPYGVLGLRPVAVLGLTAASNIALAAELVVRFTGLVERDRES